MPSVRYLPLFLLFIALALAVQVLTPSEEERGELKSARPNVVDSRPPAALLLPRHRRHHHRHRHHWQGQQIPFIPSYRRKSINSHSCNETSHHFANYTGYSDVQKIHQERRQREEGEDRKKQANKNDALYAPPPSPPSPPSNSGNAIVAANNANTNTTGTTTARSYQLVNDYSGSTFFDGFYFYTAADPTGGMIQYVDKTEAKKTGLIGLKDGNAIMKIASGDRNDGIQKSVRISTEDSFTTGLVMLDAVHMPTGCGVWPAFWTNPIKPRGAWPEGGEIDLVEGVHYFQRNMYSIHAPSSCSMTSSVDMLGKLAMPDKALAMNCDPKITDDQGCGVQSQENGDFGDAYNKANGGVHILDWDSDTGIHAYFFPRDKIPADVTDGNPEPSRWGTPRATWPASACKPDDYFQEHAAVFTNTVCGTWGGSDPVWNNAMGGQSFTCKQHTKRDSCYQYMLDGPDLSEAYWEIKSVKIYQKSRRH